MRFPAPPEVSRAVRLLALAVGAAVPMSLPAQRDSRAPAPAAVQAFDAAECRSDCVVDTLSIDIDRGRRAQAGVVLANLVLVDTLPIAKRGAPPTPRDRAVHVWVSCDSAPCGAAIVSGRITDKRIDDARVSRRVQATWTLPAPMLSKLLRTSVVSVVADGRVHPLSAAMVSGTHALIEPVRATVASAVYSPRATL
ncbi:MAG: hypothetical protein H7099_17810, partial [Gemmatimonadaceae bacterium]|nr:hypothetical protein [Gemmatimonadaceae bacterium]